MEKTINEISNEELCTILTGKDCGDLSYEIDRNEYLILKGGYFESETDADKIEANELTVNSVLNNYNLAEDMHVREGVKRLKELFAEAGTKRVQLRFSHLAQDLKYNH